MPHMCCGGSWWSDEHHLTDDCLWWQLLCVAELLFSISMLFSSLFVMSTFAIEVQDTHYLQYAWFEARWCRRCWV